MEDLLKKWWKKYQETYSENISYVHLGSILFLLYLFIGSMVLIGDVRTNQEPYSFSDSIIVIIVFTCVWVAGFISNRKKL